MATRVKRTKVEAIKREFAKKDNEPVWGEGSTHADLCKALYWYHNNKTENDAAKYLGIKSVHVASRFLSLAWATRLQSRGFPLNEKEQSTLKKMRSELDKMLAATVAPVAPTDPAPSIQERVKKITDDYIGELEELVDRHGIHGKHSEFNVYQWLKDNDVKGIHASKIADHFQACLKEVTLAAAGKNEELKEAYSTYSKSRLNNLMKFYGDIVSDAKKLCENKKVARKPRKKKPISFEKKVAKVTYLKSDDKLKVHSVDPVKIIGAQQLWVFNVKTRKLGVYNALDSVGLDIKGTTIQNYGVESSTSKTVRKPENILPTVVSGGKVALRKVMDDIKAKPSPLNGRIGKDVLILRVN